MEARESPLRRARPREVLLHGTFPHRLPGFLVVLVRVQRMPKPELQTCSRRERSSSSGAPAPRRNHTILSLAICCSHMFVQLYRVSPYSVTKLQQRIIRPSYAWRSSSGSSRASSTALAAAAVLILLRLLPAPFAGYLLRPHTAHLLPYKSKEAKGKCAPPPAEQVMPNTSRSSDPSPTMHRRLVIFVAASSPTTAPTTAPTSTATTSTPTTPARAKFA